MVGGEQAGRIEKSLLPSGSSCPRGLSERRDAWAVHFLPQLRAHGALTFFSPQFNLTLWRCRVAWLAPPLWYYKMKWLARAAWYYCGLWLASASWYYRRKWLATYLWCCQAVWLTTSAWYYRHIRLALEASL